MASARGSPSRAASANVRAALLDVPAIGVDVSSGVEPKPRPKGRPYKDTLAVNQAQYSVLCYPDGGIVDESGGVVIPAHANSDHKGILRLFQGGLELRKVLENPALLAMETVGKTVLKALPPLTVD